MLKAHHAAKAADLRYDDDHTVWAARYLDLTEEELAVTIKTVDRIIALYSQHYLEHGVCVGRKDEVSDDQIEPVPGPDHKIYRRRFACGIFYDGASTPGSLAQCLVLNNHIVFHICRTWPGDKIGAIPSAAGMARCRGRPAGRGHFRPSRKNRPKYPRQFDLILIYSDLKYGFLA